MKFLALLSVAAAVKVASKAKAHSKNTKMTFLQSHAEVDTEAQAGCTDWDDWGETDIGGDGCAWYGNNVSSCGMWDDEDFYANVYCCACGGGMPEDWVSYY